MMATTTELIQMLIEPVIKQKTDDGCRNAGNQDLEPQL